MRFPVVGRVAVFAFVAALASCSSGDKSDTRTEVSTNSLSFSAPSPDAPAPAAQTLTATFGTGTVFYTVLSSGVAIASVTQAQSGSSTQITVTPANPTDIGAGAHAGAVTVIGYSCADPDCSRFTPGNTQVVSVSYGIPPIVRYVAPYVGVANASQKAIVRGRGFEQFAIQSVTFGAAVATEFTVESDTEIHATYPALTAGTYAVQIDVPTAPAAVQSTANLVVTNPPAFAATTLAYPSASTIVKRLIYDGERQALLLAVSSAAGDQVLRYGSSGGVWAAPSSAAVTDLTDLTLTTDGVQILALAQQSLSHLDPVSLGVSAATPAPAFATSGTFLKSLAVGNAGNAVVATGFATTNNTPLYYYNTRNPEFTQPASTVDLNNATAAASADRSKIWLVQGDPTVTSPPSVYQYAASTQLIGATSITLNQNTILPAIDREATRFVLNGTNVYDSDFGLLGTLPATTGAVVLRPDATRAYTFDSTSGQVHAFDLTATPNGGAFPEVGSGTALAGSPGSDVRMAISADGGSLFLAGSNQIVVQPTPP